MMMKGENEVKNENVTADENEKRAAVSKISINFIGKSNNPNVLEVRAIVTVSLLLSCILQIIVVVLSLMLGPTLNGLATISFLLLMAGLIELLIEEHKFPKFFKALYTWQYLLNLCVAGYGMRALCSPLFCQISAYWFVNERCQNNLGLIRAVGLWVLFFNVVFQTDVLCNLRRVYGNVKMIENPKKQTIPEKTLVELQKKMQNNFLLLSTLSNTPIRRLG